MVRVHARGRDGLRVEVQGVRAEPLVDLADTYEATVHLAETEGSQPVRIVAVTADGREAEQVLPLTLDRTPPRVTVLSPVAVNPDRAPQSMRIEGRVEDATLVNLHIEGQAVEVSDGAFSYTLRASSRRELSVTACDAAGNEVKSVHRIAVDVDPPQLLLDGPAPAVTRWTRSPAITLVGRVKDAHPPEAVRVAGRDVPLEGTRFEATATLKEGTNTLTLSCRDSAGNEGQLQVIVVRDSTPPVISLSEELPAELLAKKNQLEVRGRVSEACTLTLNGKAVSCEEGAFRAKLRLKKGANALLFLARDAAGNEGRVEADLTYLRPRAGLVPKGTWWKPGLAQLLCAQKTGHPLWFTARQGMRFVLVPPGTFLMGSPAGEAGRHEKETQHEVELTRPFYLSATEVTNEELARIDPDHRSGSAFGYQQGAARQPATQTTWGQAQKLAAALSRLDPKVDYRLPTEAEWEYACRAGTAGPHFWGDDLAAAKRHCNGFDPISHDEFGENNPVVARRTPFPGDDGFRATAPVGSLLPNPWGLYDMLGNVDEWVADTFSDYPSGAVRDPLVQGGNQRIVRGGSYHMSRTFCRAANRWRHDPDQAGVSSGIRLVAWPVKKRRR